MAEGNDNELDDVDTLLDELADLKLDLGTRSSTRGALAVTDAHDRTLNSMGPAARRKSSPVAGASVITEFDKSSRPTTAQVLEELERQGLEHLPPPPLVDRKDSLDLLAAEILSDVDSSVAQSRSPSRLLSTPAKAQKHNSIDALLQEISAIDEEVQPSEI